MNEETQIKLKTVTETVKLNLTETEIKEVQLMRQPASVSRKVKIALAQACLHTERDELFAKRVDRVFSNMFWMLKK